MKYLPLIFSLLLIGGCDDGGSGGSGGSSLPSLQFTGSRVIGAQQGAPIEFYATDPDSVATISFFYDDDDRDFDGTLIPFGVQENDSNGVYTWDVSALPEGLYFVYGIIDDSVNPPVTSTYRPHPFIVSFGSNIPPYITFDAPTGSQPGPAVIWYDLWADTIGQLNVYADYRGGSVGSSWAPATLRNNLGIPDGPSSLIWDSNIDEAGVSASDYQLRLWAEDLATGAIGPIFTSGPFTVNN